MPESLPSVVYQSHDRPPLAPPIDETPAPRCDICEQLIEGAPGGEGLLLWARGGELHQERAPICQDCATTIGVAALRRLDEEEEEGLQPGPLC